MSNPANRRTSVVHDREYVRKTGICIKCGKKFKLKNYNQIYCNDPCCHHTAKGKEARLKYWYINSIRALFRTMYRSNPNEALKLKEQMEREEGPEFVDMVLDGMTETSEFKQLSKIYNKYKSKLR